MHWFRSKRAFGGVLALLALALQLALAFGHIHKAEFAGVPGHAQVAVVSAPASDSPADNDGDHCAICATAQLLGNGVATAPPVLPQAAEFIAAPLAPIAAPLWRGTTHRPFSARAPPLA